MRKGFKFLKVFAVMLSMTSMLVIKGNVHAEEIVSKASVSEASVSEAEASIPVIETALKDDTAQQEKMSTKKLYANANVDIVGGKQVRMPLSNLGVVVDGYQLNHDYVKILNINNGAINIYDESYTQGSANEPWTTQEDAYVIKGQGTSANNITITPTTNEITVYLLDLEWKGVITINGNATKVNLVVCGNVKNSNTSYSIYVSRQNGLLSITGLNGTQDVFTSNMFLYNFYGAYYVPRTMVLKDISIDTNSFIRDNGYDSNYYDDSIEFDNVVLNNNGNFYYNVYRSIIVKNSILNQIDFMGHVLTCTDSVINFRNPVLGEIYSTNSTLAFNSGTASNLPKINLENSSLFTAVNFIGTPVDKDADDLYVKKIRMRQFPTTFVYISVNNGPEARLRTDANGYIYPFVKKGTTRIDARLEDGRTYYATFAPTTAADNSTTNLIQSAESLPVIVACSAAQNITVGETLSLFVTATPGTTGKSLSYQWYKNDIVLTGETKATLTKSEAVTNDSGSYKCMVKENGGGTSTSGNIEVVVNKAESPNSPVIKNMTSDMDLIVGSSITLTVNAEPSVATNGLSYQWYVNGDVIGSDSNQLIITKITLEQAGSYKCVITEENINTTVETGVINIAVSNPS